ncbi:peroxiredoxin [Pseudaestuariivita atlantica]|uniref:thioredoxin-dependent peroxiredoxin n=1 Tax=Pseudaestuariivita atlantica TaxID=1317121 RepID=A0A0L1JN44_9RHOB|nr:peroxiredoxin [Pseudaestuariivita atlantica]KNG93174.1 alkyl hydroperoxide reductase [Pseudaestuariivita atlantica]
MPADTLTAPALILPRDGGGTVDLSAVGGPYVLFFYPKDDTPGCTKESIAFTGLLPEFDAAGVKVFGCSRDTVAKHDKFIAKHDLGMPLLSDEDGALTEHFDVWVEKQMYGKTYMGIERSTFLIDADGNVAREWRKVKVPGHAEEVLEAAKAL